MNNHTKKTFWQRNWWFGIAVLCFAVYIILQQTWIFDWYKGLSYAPSAEVAQIEDDLELTTTGRRIFAATHPVVEGSSEFNEHCKSHDAEVSLLGCYTDGQIYIYEVTLEELGSAKTVTAAHELLHANWERMGTREREEVSGWLQQLYDDKREWFDEELEIYAEENYLEEIYARAGTKLADLPGELETHYAKIFQNRAQIVRFYDEYEAPFLTLQTELADLAQTIKTTNAEIDAERTTYQRSLKQLEAKIERFNDCADTTGCFASEAEFSRQRKALLAERSQLEATREKLNEKILQNNHRVEEYRTRQEDLGKLNDAMNSNIELIQIVE